MTAHAEMAPRPRVRALLDPCPPPRLGRAGDPGLYGPGSVAWTIGRERALLAGGGAALLLQLAHPKVAAGVAEHSAFRRDPFARLRATLDAMLRVTFGDTEQARAAAREVAAIHRRVRGQLASPAGPFAAREPYSATDPDLALWVHSTLVRTALDGFDRFVRPLRPDEAEAYYLQTRAQARLFGVPSELLPSDFSAFDAYVEGMVRGRLVVSADARALAPNVMYPPTPASMRPALSALGMVTAGLLPDSLRTAYGLPWGARQRASFHAMSAAGRAAVHALPARYRFWPHYQVARRRMAAPAGHRPRRQGLVGPGAGVRLGVDDGE